MLTQNPAGLYAITDCSTISTTDLLKKSELILNAGIALFQYRNKSENKAEKKELALKLQSLCQRYKTPFIVNDDLELATNIDADGIHLGKNDIDINTARKSFGKKIIGVSCYNDLERAIVAEQFGADYVAFGSFFPSATKPDAVKADIELLIQSKNILNIPVVAIGGITPENGKELIKAKVDYLAVINGLYSANETVIATQRYKNLFKNYV